MAVAQREIEVDSLASLEERISRAVEVVATLRRENQDLLKRVESAEAERDRVETEARAAAVETGRVSQELDDLRSERKQVRSRIEKLLGQMDLLTSS